MPGIEINKKNHEKLMAIRDEQGLKSFNQVLDKILPKGAVSGMDFETEQPAFALLNQSNEILNVSWEDLKKEEIGKTWNNGETATIIYKENDGCLIKFKDLNKDVYLNYFHFLD